MNRQAVPVSGTGHALVDLAGVARVKAHGEIAHKSLTNYVYDGDNSIKFPSGISPGAKLFVQQNHPRQRRT